MPLLLSGCCPGLVSFVGITLHAMAVGTMLSVRRFFMLVFVLVLRRPQLDLCFGFEAVVDTDTDWVRQEEANLACYAFLTKILPLFGLRWPSR